jgi:hypothetical protein
MSTLCRTYVSDAAARRAVAALRAAGVPEHDIRVLTGSRRHDVREEPVGAFRGTLPPDAPVGTFANRRRRRRQGAGAFAGDPDRQRKGSFGDADLDVIHSFDHGHEHDHVTGDSGVRRLLRSAAVDGAAAVRLVEELHAGHTVVLAEVDDARAAATQLDAA